MENHFFHSIDSTLPTICSRTDHPNFGNLHGFSLWSFLSSVFIPTILLPPSALYLLRVSFSPQSSWPSYQAYLPTSTTKRQASQGYTTSRLVLDYRQRLNWMLDSWIVFIYTIKTRKVALDSPSLDCVSYLFLSRCGGGYWWFSFSNLLIATMVPASIVLPIGLILSGWAAQRHLHWIATDIVRTTVKKINFEIY